MKASAARPAVAFTPSVTDALRTVHPGARGTPIEHDMVMAFFSPGSLTPKPERTELGDIVSRIGSFLDQGAPLH